METVIISLGIALGTFALLALIVWVIAKLDGLS